MADDDEEKKKKKRKFDDESGEKFPNKSLDDFISQTPTKPKDFAMKLRSDYDKLDKESVKSVLNFADLARKKFKK